MSEEVIKEKFHDCATRAVSEGSATELYGCLRNLRDRKNLHDLWPMLAADD